MQNSNILIVGAGIAGLTFANLLKRQESTFKIIVSTSFSSLIAFYIGFKII